MLPRFFEWAAGDSGRDSPNATAHSPSVTSPGWFESECWSGLWEFVGIGLSGFKILPQRFESRCSLSCVAGSLPVPVRTIPRDANSDSRRYAPVRRLAVFRHSWCRTHGPGSLLSTWCISPRAVVTSEMSLTVFVPHIYGCTFGSLSVIPPSHPPYTL